MKEIDPKAQEYYLSFTKRFKGLEGMRSFAEHVTQCPDCMQLFAQILKHMETRRKG